MAIQTEDKLDKPNTKPADGEPAKRTKNKRTLKKYSAKKPEIQVRKRYIQNDRRDSALGTHSTMFYPTTYYPVTFNGWTSGLQCPVYVPLPVIVNPQLSTQICPYSPLVQSPVTVSNEFPISPLVPMTNEFPLITNDASMGTPNELPLYCETVNHLPQYSNLDASHTPVSNEALLETHFMDMQILQPSYEVRTPLTPLSSNYSPLFTYGCDSLPHETQLTDILDGFSPIQDIQVTQDVIPNYSNELSPSSCSAVSYEYNDFQYSEENNNEHKPCKNNPLEFYLSLPKDLFPTANMMTIDPNAIIDEFCKVSSLDDYSWILDLEFGIPKTPVKRRVATYDVKLNSIHCKNTPEAIHPGFERCDKDLKRILVFYYDCVISNWYRGYMAVRNDGSVENFQSWLLLPMQVLGMCWP